MLFSDVAEGKGRNRKYVESDLVIYIEEFSERSSEKQAHLVRRFLEYLSKHLENLSELQPDAFSTGDGAIVSVGRQCEINTQSTKNFIQFSIDFTAALCNDGITIRTAVNSVYVKLLVA